MKTAIKNIENELKKAKNRCSTNNTYDYAYSNGLEYALKQIKLFDTQDVIKCPHCGSNDIENSIFKKFSKFCKNCHTGFL